MDFPNGAKVINASVNLGLMGRDEKPSPPIECFLRVIDQPMLKLTSTDLNASAEIHTIAEVFDFAKDYLGLLKAAVGWAWKSYPKSTTSPKALDWRYQPTCWVV